MKRNFHQQYLQNSKRWIASVFRKTSSRAEAEVSFVRQRYSNSSSLGTLVGGYQNVV